jgi:MFS family permease
MTHSPDPRQLRRVVGASLVGTTIEWYDFFVYASAAGLVFGKQFFPALDETAAVLASFATLGVSFVARPIGGVVAGHLGDRFGRKVVLVWTLLLMGIATVGVGLLPGYSSIGVAAPVLLVTLRLLQGLSAGGEWGGAALMSVEHAPAGRRGLFGSFPQMGVPIGLLLANLVFFTVTATTTDEQFTSWGWRIPFLLSVVLIAVGSSCGPGWPRARCSPNCVSAGPAARRRWRTCSARTPVSWSSRSDCSSATTWSATSSSRSSTPTAPARSA